MTKKSNPWGRKDEVVAISTACEKVSFDLWLLFIQQRSVYVSYYRKCGHKRLFRATVIESQSTASRGVVNFYSFVVISTPKIADHLTVRSLVRGKMICMSPEFQKLLTDVQTSRTFPPVAALNAVHGKQFRELLLSPIFKTVVSAPTGSRWTVCHEQTAPSRRRCPSMANVFVSG